jgi:hypothetical protein
MSEMKEFEEFKKLQEFKKNHITLNRGRQRAR